MESTCWLDPDPSPKLSPERRTFFSSYAGLEGESLSEHLQRIQAKAWSIRQYPCIGQYGFLNPRITLMPGYDHILARLKAEATFLDAGCGLGQDLRKLVHDGAPSTHLYATDIEQRFWDLSYDLYKDEATFGATFLPVDLVRATPSLLQSQLKEKIDVVYASGLLHLWDWPSQLSAIRNMMCVTRVGSEIFGRNMGCKEASPVSEWREGAGSSFLHDATSFRALWQEAAKASTTKWEMEVETLQLSYILSGNVANPWLNENVRELVFEAKRTA